MKADTMRCPPCGEFFVKLFANEIGIARSGLFAAAIAAWSLVALLPSLAEQMAAKIVGLGAATCVQFTNDIKQNPAVQRDYLAWAQGFMSGVLLGRPPEVDKNLDLHPPTFPLRKQLEFLRDHCSQNPASDFSDAVLSLYKRLRKEGAI